MKTTIALQEYLRLVSERNALREGLNEALGIIQWMSGSSDFGPEGQAHEGWIKARGKMDELDQLAKGDSAYCGECMRPAANCDRGEF